MFLPRITQALTKFHHRQPKNTIYVNILSCFVYTEKKESSIRLNLNEVCYCYFSSREHKSVNFCYTWIVYCSQALKIHVYHINEKYMYFHREIEINLKSSIRLLLVLMFWNPRYMLISYLNWQRHLRTVLRR